eukprot:gene18055-biopygen15951
MPAPCPRHARATQAKKNASSPRHARAMPAPRPRQGCRHFTNTGPSVLFPQGLQAKPGTCIPADEHSRDTGAISDPDEVPMGLETAVFAWNMYFLVSGWLRPAYSCLYIFFIPSAAGRWEGAFQQDCGGCIAAHPFMFELFLNGKTHVTSRRVRPGMERRHPHPHPIPMPMPMPMPILMPIPMPMPTLIPTPWAPRPSRSRSRSPCPCSCQCAAPLRSNAQHPCAAQRRQGSTARAGQYRGTGQGRAVQGYKAWQGSAALRCPTLPYLRVG